MSESLPTTEQLNLNEENHFDFNIEDIKKQIRELREKRQYQSALTILNDIKNNHRLHTQQEFIILHDLYIQVLLDIEDYPSLLNILKSKKKYLTTSKDINMHRFYEAICFEGLEQLERAIQSLNAIEDVLSRPVLVNKYLKLAILYAQTKQIIKAKEALNYAEVFDREKDHPMFLLAKSDIYYQEGKYIKAIQFYEDFYIKTDRKMSYLNRYIRISFALNRLNDAFDFYQRHKEAVYQLSKRQSRIAFFMEALPVLKRLDQDAYIEVNNYLEDMKKQPAIRFDDFEYYQLILNQSQKHKIYSEDREIYRDYFLDLDSTNVFEKMMILQFVNGEGKLYHYSKKLLLEKAVGLEHPILFDCLRHEYHSTYTRPDLDGFVFVNDDIDVLFIEAIEKETFLLMLVKKANYDLAKRLTLLSSGLIKDKLHHLSLLKTLQSEHSAYINLLDKAKIGCIKIQDNHVFMLNETVKQIVGVDQSSIPFMDLQQRIEPKLYVDDFLDLKQTSLTVNNHLFNCQSYVEKTDIYVMFSSICEVKPSEWTSNEKDSLILIDISNYRTLIESLGYCAYQSQLKNFIEALPEATNYHLKDYQVFANHQILILLDHRDKRIFDRLDKKIKQELLEGFDLRMAYHHFNHDLKESIYQLEQLIYLTHRHQPKQSGDLPLRKHNEVEMLYSKMAKGFIRDKQIRLIHAFVKHWHNKQVAYVDIEIDDLGVLKNELILERVLKNEALEVAWDRLVVNQLLQDARVYDAHTCFIIPIHSTSIESKKEFNYLLRRLKRLEGHRYIFKMHISDYLNLSQSDREYILEKSIDLMLEGPFNDIHQLNQLTKQSLCLIDSSIVSNEFSNAWLAILRQKFDTIIFDHHDKQLLKTDLLRLQIELVKGRYSGRKVIDK